ncbi:MAG: hypothetical protein WCG87_12970 [Bacteroidota bacterium]
MLQVVFTESQRSGQTWWVFLLILAVAIFVGIRLSRMKKEGKKITLALKLLLITCGVLPCVFIFIFMCMKLNTRIDNTAVYYGFSLSDNASEKIPWSSVQKAYVRQYKPLAEYGGWGMREGTRDSDRAFNVAGDMGLQLQYDKGNRMLIGTQKPEEIRQLLRQLVQAGIVKDTTPIRD